MVARVLFPLLTSCRNTNQGGDKPYRVRAWACPRLGAVFCTLSPGADRIGYGRGLVPALAHHPHPLH